MIICELQVPWEDHVEDTYERKKKKYQELIDICKEKGYQSYRYPVEVGWRGFIAHSTMLFLEDMGIVGKERQTVCKMFEKAAETGLS